MKLWVVEGKRGRSPKPEVPEVDLHRRSGRRDRPLDWAKLDQSWIKPRVKLRRTKNSQSSEVRSNLDRPSRGTRVSRLACSGFRRSGELVCAEERTPEA
jgi:hypothetical protein